MRLSEHQQEFSKDVATLITWADEHGFGLTFGEAHRTQEQQDIYLANGKSKRPRSRHQDRLAVDLFLFLNGVYQETKDAYQPLGTYWKSLDPLNRWGGDFLGLVDSVHFERAVPEGPTTQAA